MAILQMSMLLKQSEFAVVGYAHLVLASLAREFAHGLKPTAGLDDAEVAIRAVEGQVHAK